MPHDIRLKEHFKGQESEPHSLSPFFPVSRKPLPPLPGLEGQSTMVTMATKKHSKFWTKSIHHSKKQHIFYTTYNLNQGQALQSAPDNEGGEEEVEEEEEGKEVVVVALYNFHGAEPHDLPLVKGSEYIIIENCDVNWFKARNKYG